MAHFFERDDLPGVSGKIIEEHGSEYYRCEIDGQEYPVKYELIRPSGFDYRTGAVENAQSASTRGPRLDKADYVQQLGYYEKNYTEIENYIKKETEEFSIFCSKLYEELPALLNKLRSSGL